MKPRSPSGRSGITLVEILLSILIMGVGVVSVATLFPLGLQRLRDANRYTRSAYLYQSAIDEMNTRNLLSKTKFLSAAYAPWYQSTFVANPSTGVYDPFLQDLPLPTVTTTAGVTTVKPGGIFRFYGWDGGNYTSSALKQTALPIHGEGLPVAYDPLWWTMVGLRPNGFDTSKPAGTPAITSIEARFGSGLMITSTTTTSTIRDDPNPHTGDPGSPMGAVYGLPRLTNFLPGFDDVVRSIFVSPEDIIWQTDSEKSSTGLSPLVPDLAMSSGQVTNDYRYTWMFTGQLTDAGDPGSFDGDIVVFENRPFAFENGIAAGEVVVEAIFGYSANVINASQTAAGVSVTRGYGPQPSRTVVLRWQPSVMADPEVKVGSWLADVTYEKFWQTDQNDQADATSVGVTSFPNQRCEWYRVVKKTQPGDDILGVAGFRSMTVWVAQPLRALTLLDSTGAPYHVNSALVSPYVVNVFSTTVESQ